jgi:hypothetical protein
MEEHMSTKAEMAQKDLRLWEARTCRLMAAAGLGLDKSTARSPRVMAFGRYGIFYLEGGGSVLECFSLSRAEVDDWIANQLAVGVAASEQARPSGGAS